MTRFEDLSLIEPLLRAVREEGYDVPTPIQNLTIPHVLAGRDLLGCAQTGTGKTAAFALPILQRLQAAPAPGSRAVRVLVLSPTRELASQIGDSFTRYGRHTAVRLATIYGGVGHAPQSRALRSGVDVVVATPGRLLDFMGTGVARLDRVEILVLDEADRMLDMGFIHDVRRVIAALPRKRQTLFFSATLPHDIQSLARDILSSPVRVEVTPTATTVDKIAQSLFHVNRNEKLSLLTRLLQDPALRRTLVFTRTKRGANRLAEELNRSQVQADAIHGNKSQGARERALENFKRGASRVLVATDIAARGIDIEEISHVVNFDMPDLPENYVHRIGRTARAGTTGVAIAFCAPEEREELAAVERLIRMRIPVRSLRESQERATLRPPAPSNLSGPDRTFASGEGRNGQGGAPGTPPGRRHGGPEPAWRRVLSHRHASHRPVEEGRDRPGAPRERHGVPPPSLSRPRR